VEGREGRERMEGGWRREECGMLGKRERGGGGRRRRLLPFL
jgi:hypothetical protein